MQSALSTPPARLFYSPPPGLCSRNPCVCATGRLWIDTYWVIQGEDGSILSFSPQEMLRRDSLAKPDSNTLRSCTRPPTTTTTTSHFRACLLMKYPFFRPYTFFHLRFEISFHFFLDDFISHLLLKCVSISLISAHYCTRE